MPASEPVRLGRKRVLPRCPNPLFLRWLTELRDEAREKGLKIQYTYQKAICSLNKYPLPLQNAREAKILQNFGDGICKLLDQKLEKFYRENGEKNIWVTSTEHLGGNKSGNSQEINNLRKKSGGGGGRKRRPYVPQKGSGGYAVLLTLYRHSQIPGAKGFMFKLELQSEAQRLCDKSFTVPDPGSKYTAWSSVSTLIQKNLLVKTHNPARYSGRAPPAAVLEWSTSHGATTTRRKAGRRESPTAGLSELCDRGASGNPAAHRLLPGSYDIVLCVDFIETTGGSSHRKQELVKELQRNGVAFDVRKLNVGDFLWVAREKVAPLPGQLRAPDRTELVLDYIVERKRMDDLCGSIIDGRFREQKFRLKRCGLRRPVYLVEECGSAASHLSLPESTLQQAIVNTQVVDGFFVKRVQDVRESAAYLTIMTRHLTKLYQNRTLTCRSRELQGDAHATGEVGTPCCSLMSFAEFNHGAVKNKCQTVREVFARQLMQISGLSGDKAAAILQQYSTPSSLLGAYQRCSSESEKEKLLSSIRYGKLKRNLGPALSRTVYQLYCTQGALS
uniref:Crossover junction endonuclease MUS81 n=1 Tax=Salarias fasciatus TaxID=181472 RepID=A0A672JC92_SALFA